MKQASIRRQCVVLGRIKTKCDERICSNPVKVITKKGTEFIQAKKEVELKKLAQEKAQKELEEQFSIEAKTGFWRCYNNESRYFSCKGTKHCGACDNARVGVIAVNQSSGSEWMINGKYSCTSKGVVYLITCSKDGMQYVGKVIIITIDWIHMT